MFLSESKYSSACILLQIHIVKDIFWDDSNIFIKMWMSSATFTCPVPEWVILFASLQNQGVNQRVTKWKKLANSSTLQINLLQDNHMKTFASEDGEYSSYQYHVRPRNKVGRTELVKSPEWTFWVKLQVERLAILAVTSYSQVYQEPSVHSKLRQHNVINPTSDTGTRDLRLQKTVANVVQ